jgi:hypothetical protein
MIDLSERCSLGHLLSSAVSEECPVNSRIEFTQNESQQDKKKKKLINADFDIVVSRVHRSSCQPGTADRPDKLLTRNMRFHVKQQLAPFAIYISL